MRIEPRFPRDIHRPIVRSESDPELQVIEGKGAGFHSPLSKRLGGGREHFEFLVPLATPGVNKRLSFFLAEPLVGSDDGFPKPFIRYAEMFVERENRREGKLVFIRIQTAEIIREALGEHGYGSINKVN